MKELIEALNIFLKYTGDARWPFHCEHEILYVTASEGLDIDSADADRLVELGFEFDAEEYNCWYSYRYGSS